MRTVYGPFLELSSQQLALCQPLALQHFRRALMCLFPIDFQATTDL
jgi:hypothetical protein